MPRTRPCLSVPQPLGVLHLHLPYALAAASPGRLQHDGVPNAGAAGQRLVQAVDAGPIVTVKVGVTIKVWT